MQLNRHGLAATAAALTSTILLGPHGADLVATLRGPDFPEALFSLLALGHLAVSAAFLAAVSATVLGAGCFVPSVLLTGAALAAGGPASASVDGLRLPDRPVVHQESHHTVTVEPGDTLWAIAGHGLQDNRAIATAVRHWHAENRDVIGPDPDVLRPGQVLRVPR